MKAKVAAATTPEAKQALAADVKALGKEVRKDRHDAEFDATNRLASMNHRIEAGLKDGSLNLKEAARLTGKVAGLAALQAAGITSPKLFNQVSNAIFGQRHDANVDTARVAKGIEETLAKPASCLTPEQVAAFKERLAKLSASNAPAAGAQLTCNLTGPMPLNFAAAYSDYHVTGLNPAGNATLTDLAFVASRFRITQSRAPAT